MLAYSTPCLPAAYNARVGRGDNRLRGASKVGGKRDNTVKKYMKCSRVSEILHEIVRDATRKS